MPETIKMKLPEGTSVVSWSGKEFHSDDKGCVLVPVEAENALLSFGLLTVGKNVVEAATEVASLATDGHKETKKEPKAAKEPKKAKQEPETPKTKE